MKRKILMLGLIVLAILCIPVITRAADNANVQVQKEVKSSGAIIRFTFTGLTLDTNKEYQFGLTKAEATEVKVWHLITSVTENTAIVEINVTSSTDFKTVIDEVDTGYVTIKEKGTDTIILQPYAVDLKVPYMQVTDYAVIGNGKEFGSGSDGIHVALRNPQNSKAYYQYEKITDENLINKYKEIKNSNGDYLQLGTMLKTAPTSNWKTWKYWNGANTTGGFGYTEKPISTPDSGLYYMWLYFSGDNIKPLYGVILVDNLQPEIALESISLPKTATVKMGQTIKLNVTFNPSNATNKIVTWSSSDKSVATVDNTGKITPKKVGSTIITVVSKDGNKKATCTVTVTTANATENNTNNGSSSNGNDNKNDTTTATGKLPQTGISGVGITVTMGIVAIIGLGAYVGYRKLKGI